MPSNPISDEGNGVLNVTLTTRRSSISAIHPNGGRPLRRIIENYFLIWVDSCFDEPTIDYDDEIKQLECIFSIVYMCPNIDACLDFLQTTDDGKISLIISSCLSDQIIPLIHDIPQLELIYILGDETTSSNGWSKVKGVHSRLPTIYNALKQNIHQCNRNSIPLSFVPSNDDPANPSLDQLDPSFMYTQIFKEILLANKYDRKSIEDLVAYCRQQYGANNSTLRVITEFEREYCYQRSIRWYTRPCFIYDMLNGALRNLEADIITKMGFFINNLHNCIAELHLKEKFKYGAKPFTVYRGQGLSTSDFKQLMKSVGGLISFNSFLSTSIDRDVSLMFADSNNYRPDTIGILFKITVDPSISTSPYAHVQNLSFCYEEGEVLFSMHTVFRIGQIEQLLNNTCVWQVELKSTSDEDQQLSALAQQIRQETSGSTGYERLGKLLITIGQLDKAEELYQVLLNQTTNMKTKLICCQQIGEIKDKREDYENAILFYKQALEIKEKIYPIDYSELGIDYMTIGAMYTKMNDLSTAAEMHARGMELLSKCNLSKHLHLNVLSKWNLSKHPDLIVSYIDTGRTFNRMSEQFESLSSFQEEAQEIYKKNSSDHHPELAASYNSIGVVYHDVGEFSKALSYYEKALEIFQKILPANHPSLATSYNNIAAVCKNTGEYSIALSYYEKSLEIRQRTLPSSHPDLANSYNNIGMLYEAMGEYSTALSYQEKALAIRETAVSAHHPDLAISYTNIATVYRTMDDYSKALSYHEKAIEIRKNALPSCRLDLAHSYTLLGKLYDDMKQFPQALFAFDHAMDILRGALPPDHPDLQALQTNIELVQNKLHGIVDK